MRLFLDASVLLAASGSTPGASREIFRLAPFNGWELLATPYVLEETVHNLPLLPLAASADWIILRNALAIRDDVLTIDRPAVFPVTKDRPVLFSALAWADVLLTLDYNDFAALLSSQFYGLEVLKPGTFLERARAAGRLMLNPSRAISCIADPVHLRPGPAASDPLATTRHRLPATQTIRQRRYPSRPC